MKLIRWFLILGILGFVAFGAYYIQQQKQIALEKEKQAQLQRQIAEQKRQQTELQKQHLAAVKTMTENLSVLGPIEGALEHKEVAKDAIKLSMQKLKDKGFELTLDEDVFRKVGAYIELHKEGFEIRYGVFWQCGESCKDYYIYYNIPYNKETKQGGQLICTHKNANPYKNFKEEEYPAVAQRLREFLTANGLFIHPGCAAKQAAPEKVPN